LISWLLTPCSMTRDASMFLASVCADYLVDRLALADAW
jgi:hypothetical protein